MKVGFWQILGMGILTSIGVNAVVNTVSRIRRNRLEDENYQEEILKKKEERIAKQLAKKSKKNAVVAVEEA